MEVSLISDAASVASSQGLGLAIRSNFPTSNLQFSPCSDSCSSGGGLQVSAVIFPVDAVAPPTVKSRTRLRRKRRTKRKSFGGDDSAGEGIEEWFFGGDGPIFGGGGGGDGFGGGGGGGWWNFGGSGGQSWNESSSSPSSDPAFDFVYEVISWIALWNCVHFAFKKVLRAVAGAEREKVVPMRLTSVC